MGKIGILGGTFDPPHTAHLAMADEALKKIPLDRVLFMPAPQPPHKIPRPPSAYEDRLKMVELMLEGHDGLELSRMEEFREGPSYTVELLKHFQKSSADEIFFIIGADSLNDLPAWKDPGGILELATLVVFPRTGYRSVLTVGGDASVVLFEEPVIDISSSDIRRDMAAGKDAERYLTPSVREYILSKSLYL